MKDRIGVSRKRLSWFRQGRRGQSRQASADSAIHRIIANRVCGGAYTYGKTAVPARTAPNVKIGRKTRNELLTLKPNTHDGYVSWESFEAIRAMVSSKGPTGRHHGAAKHGDALLADLIRCKRCGRKLALR